MKFIWHTALSVIDLGSSLLYNLLGRELIDDDIKLIEAIFRYMAKDSISLISNDLNTNIVLSETQNDNVNLSTSNRVRSNSSTVNVNETNKRTVEDNLNMCLNKLELECLNDETLNKDLINLILKINKGKDLLLVTTKQNGYNLLQFSLLSLLNKSFEFLNHFKSCSHLIYSNDLFEKTFDSYINNRINLIKLLLEYGCDPNRGLVFSNKSKYVINLEQQYLHHPYHLPQLKSSNSNGCKKLLLKSLSNDLPSSNTSDKTTSIETNIKQKNPFSCTINTDLNLITSKVTDEENLNMLSATPIDTPLLLICCIYNCHNLLSLNQNNQSNNSNNSHSSSNCSVTSNKINKPKTIKRKFKINRTSPTSLLEKKRNSQPINSYSKTPSITSFNNIKKSKPKFNPSRRHTIHVSKDLKTNNLLFKYNDDQEQLNLTNLTLGSPSTSKTNKSASSSGLDTSESVGEGDRETAISKIHHKNLDTTKLFNSIVKSKNNDNELIDNEVQDDQDVEEYFYEDEEEEEKEYGDDIVQESTSEDEFEEEDEEDIEEDSENEDNSSSESETCTSNIYDYEDLEDEDQSYFNRYEYDVNSNCCNLDNMGVSTNLNYALDACNLNKPNIYKSTEQIIINQQYKMSSLSTSMNSLPSSSIQANTVKTITTNITSQSNHPENGLNKNDSKSKSNLLNSKHQEKSADYFIYQKLNKNRLELLDLLLNYGADKYLVAKLSLTNVKKLNKKSLGMLKKWYDCTKPPVSVNKLDDDAFQNDQKDSEVLTLNSLTSNHELRPLSPLMASLCLDDVEVFSRLYKHHQVLFNYFKPDEDYELIYFAIKFQSKNCLIYLLSNSNSSANLPNLLSSSFSLPDINTNSNSDIKTDTVNVESTNLDQQINKNVNTMFYILENTRSSKILKVLIKCGFDLSKREPITGNTALHFLFSPSLKTNEFTKKTKSALSVLDEYRVPHSLSKILFIMLKHGGLKIHVNTLNYDKKLCIQLLFEWNELINVVFYKLKDNNIRRRLEWQHEFKECIRLLLKSGADLFLPTHDHTANTINYINSIDTLIKSILRHSLNENESLNLKDDLVDNFDSDDLMNISDLNIYNNRSPTQSLNNINHLEQFDSSPQILINNDSPKSKSKFQHNNNTNNFVLLRKLQLYQTQNKKVFDGTYLLQILNDTIDINTLTSNINRNNHSSSMATSLMGTLCFNQSIPTTTKHPKVMVTYSNCTVSTFIEILFNSYIEDFEPILKIVQLLCQYEKQLNKLRFTMINHNQTSYYSSTNSFQCNMITMVNPNIIKKLITYLVMLPNFMSSSKQFEKANFVKNLIIQLILNDLYDPNETGANNLLNHLLKLIFQSKTGYQLDILYDLMRTLIQYGADPNLDPFDSNDSLCENLILVQLCRQLAHNQLSPVLQKHYNKSCNNLRRHHFHCSHHSHYLSRHNQSQDRSSYEESSLMLSSKQQSLLTPTPSYASSINHLTSSISNVSYFLTNQTGSSSINLFNYSPKTLYTNHLKNFVKLLFDSMDTKSIQNCLKSLSTNPIIASTNSLTNISNSIQSHYFSCNYNSCNSCTHTTTTSNIIYCSLNNNNNKINHNIPINSFSQHNYQSSDNEPLDIYLERLASTPRSLKSITRRFILNHLTELNKNSQFESQHQNNNFSIILAHQQINKLPKKLRNYLLFIE